MGTAMPTGAIRMAAPLVVPVAPASSGGTPARMAATARLVEGPSRSCEPRSAMARSHSVSAAASLCGSIVPRPSIRSLASRTACSVSSVTAPAGMPPAMGWPGGAGSKPGRSGPQRRTISARESICVGMPSASPMASPYSAPRARASEDVAAVHFAEGVGEEFQAGAVGVAEVQRRAALLHVLDAGCLEVGAQRGPLLGCHRDREVVQAAEDFGVRADVQAGEVEKGQQVAVPDVEEEVIGPLVVAVLDDLGQRELQDSLVEADRPLHVGAQQGGVVDAAGAARRPFGPDVLIVQPGPLGFDRGEIHGAERNRVASDVTSAGKPGVGPSSISRLSAAVSR